MKGVVVCPPPPAADVGAAILAKGGNAFDAAVATAFSQMVNDPFMCGIGGMGTLHYYRADGGDAARASSGLGASRTEGPDRSATFRRFPSVSSHPSTTGRGPGGVSGIVDFYNRAG